jgi:hypothetical protein
MKSTELTMNVANVILILYIAYAIFFIPFNATLISLAIGLITYGTLNSYETAVSLTLISGIVFALLVKPTAKPVEAKEGFAGGTPKEISGRIQMMRTDAKVKAEPSGIHASSFVEGFADLSGNTDVASTATASMTSATPAVATPSSPTAATPSAAVDAKTAGNQNDKPPAAGFRSGGTESDALFKLGVIPEEGKGGFHIDQGTTVMSLLSNVKPMMQDGKQMLDTFQQMFGTSMPQGNPLS